MSALLVDVGNSRTKIARIDSYDNALVADIEVVDEVVTPRANPAAATGFGARLVQSRRQDEPVTVASVVPSVTAAIRRALPPARVIDHAWPFPFAVGVASPESVGADRWCNVAAAAANGDRNAIVVDAGTATTIDVLAEGVFVGGFIAPGMAFAAQALQNYGARLHQVEFGPMPLVPGRDTDEALAGGAYHVGVHGILGTVRALRERYPEAQVTVTGGLGGYLVQDGWRHDPHWLYRGIAVLACAVTGRP